MPTVPSCREARLAAQDKEWLAQVQATGGLLISIEGIQPEKGNETVYLVRAVLDLPCTERRERHL
jgi:hypothetical protein